MFQREALIRRYGFLLIDIICITLAVLLANVIRFGQLRMDSYNYLYIQTMIVAFVSCAFGYFALRLDDHLFERGYFREFVAVLKTALCMAVGIMTFLFFSQEGINYSRLQMAYFFPIYILLAYVVRVFMKRAIVSSFSRNPARKQILLVTSSDKVGQVLDQFSKTNNWY